jgi:major membrane immunogen (membrane-anchored lipoprotein)
MKKYLGIFAIVMLVAALFAGCTDTATEDPGTEDPGTEDPTGYVDGTWEGHTVMDPTSDHASVAVATLTVEGGEITAVDYFEHQVGTASAKDESYPYEDYFNAVEAMSSQLLETQDIESVDAFAGATGTSDSFVAAVNTALENSEKESGFYNGTYYSKTEVDERGYYAVAYVTFENDEVTHVLYEERNLEEDHTPKNADNYTYEDYFNAVEALSSQVMETQDAASLDAFAGATGTSDKFIGLMEDIFAQASVE